MSEQRRGQGKRKGTHPRQSGDFSILLKVKDTLDKDGVLNWDRRVPVSEWAGVATDPEEKVLRVIGLNLTWLMLAGRIPAELARLS